MKIVLLFFRRNFKKFTGIMFSMISFLLVMNLILGIVLSVKEHFKNDLVDNSDLYFIEVFNEDSPMDIPPELRKEVNSFDGVESSFFDFSHPVKITDSQKNNLDMTNILGVEIKALKYFNIEDTNVKDDFIFINKKLSNNEKFKGLKKGDKVYIRDYKYVEKDGEMNGVEYLTERTFYGFFEFNENHIFRNNISLINYNTAEKIARGMTKTGKPYFSRFIVIVPEVDKLKHVANMIESKNNNLTARYTLESTGNLPGFAVIIVAVSVLIIGILFLISIFNVSSNISQILNLRKRDFVLFNIFGIEDKKVEGMFMIELAIHGILTFTISTTITGVLFYLLKRFLEFDIFSQYIHLYILVNFVLAVGMLVLIGIIKLNTTFKSNNSMKFYKEVLKQ
ncbi:FtsX-like permease family protein [Caldisalinibacter kiritimatiensis]|uniref:ABC3 transporter permease C-terminal domain-containing protein n=1 Tax=Caldisalinibacter kiritimatiensis TaxID=1304284 RepID=R1AUA6_9FIRM|nr:FtsX-like permease family protein [Caldisalinibacter kiritimatiensis]EOD00247.1 hypothetical protein L21TH_1721 [Caldisalinibacter kiritimatiensis]